MTSNYKPGQVAICTLNDQLALRLEDTGERTKAGNPMVWCFADGARVAIDDRDMRPAEVIAHWHVTTAAFEAGVSVCPACAAKHKEEASAAAATDTERVVEKVRVAEDYYVPAVNVVAWMNAVAATVAKFTNVKAVHWSDVAGEVERMASELDVRRGWTRRVNAFSNVTPAGGPIYDDLRRDRDEIKEQCAKRTAERDDARGKVDRLNRTVEELEEQRDSYHSLAERLDAALAAAAELISALDWVRGAEDNVDQKREAFREAVQAAAPEEKPCACGSRKTYAMSPHEWIDHQPDACRIMQAEPTSTAGGSND